MAEVEVSNTPTGKKSFEVSGISRSGRLLKRSSKLLDFQSPDAVENKKYKKVGRTPRYSGRGRPSNAVRAQRNLSGLNDFSNNGSDLSAIGLVDDSLMNLEFDEALSQNSKNSECCLVTAADSDIELDNLVADLVEGVEAESLISSGENTNFGNDTRVRQSLYMIEKCNKRKILKDGKIITGKTERKDKGKTRYTAYSMWSRELRKTGKLGKNLESDFSSIARRLGELWANVSEKEKNVWKRKAKRLSTKERKTESDLEIHINTNSISSSLTTTSGNSKLNSSNFLNRATTSRNKKLSAEKQQQGISVIKTVLTSIKRNKSNSHHLNSGSVDIVNGHSPTRSRCVEVKVPSRGLISKIGDSAHSHPQNLPPPNIEPVDAAAHLKLLGESLSIIGEKLKEHDGEIALSGSLSVLLDSLLCSLGPLMCLTVRIPGLERNKKLSSNLTSTLDNIAYVLPGL